MKAKEQAAQLKPHNPSWGRMARAVGKVCLWSAPHLQGRRDVASTPDRETAAPSRRSMGSEAVQLTYFDDSPPRGQHQHSRLGNNRVSPPPVSCFSFGGAHSHSVSSPSSGVLSPSPSSSSSPPHHVANQCLPISQCATSSAPPPSFNHHHHHDHVSVSCLPDGALSAPRADSDSSDSERAGGDDPFLHDEELAQFLQHLQVSESDASSTGSNLAASVAFKWRPALPSIVETGGGGGDRVDGTGGTYMPFMSLHREDANPDNPFASSSSSSLSPFSPSLPTSSSSSSSSSSASASPLSLSFASPDPSTVGSSSSALASSQSRPVFARSVTPMPRKGLQSR
eukprot:TRINITY_DN1221_c0_g1_i1.p1 TRINITY_DN1221_c0_g1~~TRINITY_DN1221_c0_g1_i1.p1  ORF type:complete len:340 (+),score=65.08 TRINITY_DN1221_c0_g1_i1:742-1761(+)